MLITFSHTFKNKKTNLRLGLLKFNCIVALADESLWNEINSACLEIKGSLSLDQVNKLKNIAATRDGYKKCGKDPNRYRPSADSLIRRIVKGNSLYKVNNIVDILNYISIQSGISIGGYDIKKIDGHAVVDIGQPDDLYNGIGRGELNIEGLPVLRDNKGVFGSPTSDSERTMIENRTGSVAFAFFDFDQDTNLKEIMKNTQNLLKIHAKGKNFSIDIITQ